MFVLSYICSPTTTAKTIINNNKKQQLPVISYVSGHVHSRKECVITNEEKKKFPDCQRKVEVSVLFTL